MALALLQGGLGLLQGPIGIAGAQALAALPGGGLAGYEVEHLGFGLLDLGLQLGKLAGPSAAADGSELRPQGAHLAGGVRHLGFHLVQGSGQGELAGVTLAQLFGPGLVVTALALQAGQGFAAGRLALAGRLAPLGQLREGSLDLAQGAAGGGIALLQLTMPLLEGLQLGRKFAALKLG